jgi:hypothetical protein
MVVEGEEATTGGGGGGDDPSKEEFADDDELLQQALLMSLQGSEASQPVEDEGEGEEEVSLPTPLAEAVAEGDNAAGGEALPSSSEDRKQRLAALAARRTGSG